jgi:hypothetical protein
MLKLLTGRFRMLKILGVGCLAFGLGGCASLLGGNWGPFSEVTLDTALVEQEIETGILEQSGIQTSVDCPSLMQGQPGDTRNCVATAIDGSVARVVVTIESVNGDITWFVE